MTSLSELEALGLDAARSVAGEDWVEQVEVVSATDSWNRPAYTFSLLVCPERLPEHLGLTRIRLRQALGDALAARGDEGIPLIRLLRPEEWSRRTLAPAA